MAESIIFSGKIFEIVQKNVRFGNKEKIFEIARRSPGVRLIIVKGKKILMTKEFRKEHDSYDYRLPGGKVFDTLEEWRKCKNIDDASKNAAFKECLQETGLRPKDVKLYHISKAGATIEWDLYYYLIDRFEVEKQDLELGEDITPVWTTFSKARKLCIDGFVKEDRSVAMLLRFLK